MSTVESGSDNISAYWKEKFKAHPKLLHQRSNEELYQMYLADHPGAAEVPLNYKQGLSNVKSQLRDKGPKPGKRKVGRPRKDASMAASNGVAAPVAAPAVAKVAVRAPSKSLEALEEQIDECLSVAKGMTGLEAVVADLRKARNAIIIKRG